MAMSGGQSPSMEAALKVHPQARIRRGAQQVSPSLKSFTVDLRVSYHGRSIMARVIKGL